jgi:hypothetical protein
MTKISFDIDFSKDSETLLKEIQDQAKAEVEKREVKERAKAYLSSLHETVNDKIGTSYNSVTELVRALAEHASPAMQERISGSAVIAGGRRKTISMNRELYEQIKKALAGPSPNKAAIARESNLSVVQVRKVAEGGYEEKFEGTSVESVSSEPVVESVASLPESTQVDLPTPDEIPEPENDPFIEESPAVSADTEEDDSNMPDATNTIIPDLPPPPGFNDEDNGDAEISEEESDSPIPPPPSFVDEENEEVPSSVESSFESEDEMGSPPEDLPPPPVFIEESIQEEPPAFLPPSLPPVEDSFADEDQGTDSLNPVSIPPPPPPAFDPVGTEEANADDEIQLPPPGLPPIPEDLPNAPEPPAPPPSFGGELGSPPTPPSPPDLAMGVQENGSTGSPPPSKKPGLNLGGLLKKPSLKLSGKGGKARKPTLTITRPPMPMPKSLPPTPDS